ncbi:helix-turn-helix transcriptional regulator [Cocleimonas sp. KMM 6892]|uniref:helix-turn-helix transcriptional regulator n=1 Tax=unclassified Cocleimonas TaxID=2639732 RepID=UPI002DB98125|nr:MULTISPECIES: helix-turn-helix transcriptional regulator [unclassified Cocleimonas]MEB8432606.1 helix-turn-helix transcriptional regulator [Cocleimonas sp. KMM 6892]MEC4715465.1 helix-turn-helix transcriptional regulator [Cocleimonas sp. KMM 6895]MEC4744917.1 helix-turn-helix transcriptional regulator [Cocleimonas sp. KMM 6896]
MSKATKLKNMSEVGVKKTEKNLFLVSLGQRIRSLRSRRGVTRKALSARAGVSERHLANLETGEGNASILVLSQIANALNSSLAELTGDITTSSPEWLLIRSLLKNQDEASLKNIRTSIGKMLNSNNNSSKNTLCIALIGLRGAGKSTLGKMLADELDFPFIDLSSEIEKLAGCEVSEIQNLYGLNAYRRYERRALEEVVQIHPEAVIGTPGGLVSEPDTYNFLLTHCTTVWLQAKPEDHMNRVIEQGDMRPMAGNQKQAMEDLKQILASRKDFYSKSQITIDTSSQSLEETFKLLKDKIQNI